MRALDGVIKRRIKGGANMQDISRPETDTHRTSTLEDKAWHQ